MAETAKIINPEKTVILPDANAGCSLEESCPAEELEAFLNRNLEKNYYVITYINSSAAVKALSDVICTSGNAVRIVSAAPKDRPRDGILERELLSTRRIHSGEHSTDQGRVSRRGRSRAPRVYHSGAPPCGRSLFDGKNGRIL